MSIDEWDPSLKLYPHFDSPISKADILSLVADPLAVAANKFYPLLLYTQSWQPFRSAPGGKPKKKERPIRYASRRDAYIFAYYRHLLIGPYEKLLEEAGLSEAVIAYRRLRKDDGSGKSNVEFAQEAVNDIRAAGNCAVVALDISSFFESLDHGLLKKMWLRVLGVESLPADHQAVFEAVTGYSVVDRDAAYVRLGFAKVETIHGRERLTYSVPFKQMPTKLCSNKVFQEKICGHKSPLRSLVDKNRRPFGIPQGTPISDMLANLYMLDFDAALQAYCDSRGGRYYRYSDDILMIIPGGAGQATAACDFAMQEIKSHGPKMVIKDTKTMALVYANVGADQTFTHVAGKQGKNGLEYLGFRYDGRRVHVRDATISRLYRKVASSVRAECAALIARYPGKSASFLVGRFNFTEFYQRYGRVDDFDPEGSYKTWTFWTYVRKAMTAFGNLGSPIPKQLKNYRRVVRRRVVDEIVKQLANC